MPRRVVLEAVLDLVLVAVFVAVGRAGHREDQSAFLVTLWPFVGGLAVGWLAGRVRRSPSSIRSGVAAWAGALVAGMLLRAVAGQGVQPAFVIVAGVVLAAFLIGRRAIVRAVARRR